MAPKKTNKKQDNKVHHLDRISSLSHYFGGLKKKTLEVGGELTDFNDGNRLIRLSHVMLPHSLTAKLASYIASRLY